MAGVGFASLRPTGCRGEQDIPEKAKDHWVRRTEVGDARQAASDTPPPHSHKGVLITLGNYLSTFNVCAGLRWLERQMNSTQC